MQNATGWDKEMTILKYTNLTAVPRSYWLVVVVVAVAAAAAVAAPSVVGYQSCLWHHLVEAPYGQVVEAYLAPCEGVDQAGVLLKGAFPSSVKVVVGQAVLDAPQKSAFNIEIL